MQIEILGASGGIENNVFSSSYLINSSLLLDAGTGLGRLTLEQQSKITKIFLTHAHMDHICCLPLILDSGFDKFSQPVEVYALPEVIAHLREHIFNWKIWPDFTELENEQGKVLKFIPLELNKAVEVITNDGQVSLLPFPAPHTVPACSYLVTSAKDKKLVYTGDTTYTPDYVAQLNRLGQLDALLIECAFPNSLQELVEITQHLSPQLLEKLLNELTHLPKQLLVTHLKPSYTEELKQELQQQLATLECAIQYVQIGDIYKI